MTKLHIATLSGAYRTGLSHPWLGSGRRTGRGRKPARRPPRGLLDFSGLPADGAYRSEVAHPTPRRGRSVSAIGAFGALCRAGFHRYATYRQATLAAIFTNSVFGFLRTYVLLAAFGARVAVTGYDRAQLTTFVWVG